MHVLLHGPIRVRNINLESLCVTYAGADGGAVTMYASGRKQLRRMAQVAPLEPEAWLHTQNGAPAIRDRDLIEAFIVGTDDPAQMVRDLGHA
jgi:hypothetical protein